MDIYVLVTLSLGTGMRATEVLTLDRDHTDLKRGTATLIDTKNVDRRLVLFLRFPCRHEWCRPLHRGKTSGNKTIQQTQRYAYLAPDHMRTTVEQTAQAILHRTYHAKCHKRQYQLRNPLGCLEKGT